jgi:hypothetical protein
MSDTDTELLACPFCGGSVKAQTGYDHIQEGAMGLGSSAGVVTRPEIYCIQCGTFGMSPKYWNTRTASAPRADREAIARIIHGDAEDFEDLLQASCSHGPRQKYRDQITAIYAKADAILALALPTDRGEVEPVAWRYRNDLGEVVSEWIDGKPPECLRDVKTGERIATVDIRIDLAYGAPADRGTAIDGIQWQCVNDDPFEYAIQQGAHGDEFVKLLNGTCLRRALSPRNSVSEADAALARIWKALGIETYEQAGGKEISEIVGDLKARLAEAEDSEREGWECSAKNWQRMFFDMCRQRREVEAWLAEAVEVIRDHGEHLKTCDVFDRMKRTCSCGFEAAYGRFVGRQKDSGAD